MEIRNRPTKICTTKIIEKNKIVFILMILK